VSAAPIRISMTTRLWRPISTGGSGDLRICGVAMLPRLRLMTPGDITAGMRLKDAAGWNQTSQDWARFLQFNPDGCFVVECEGRVAGTVATITYDDRLAWVGMVLVDPEFRGKGIGTALLERALGYLDSRRIPCIKLDATPQGKPLYQRLGFEVEYEIERRVLRRTVDARPPVRAGVHDLDAVFAADREVFGADRSALLRSVASDFPELAIITHRGSELEGYALGRKGSLADHLGPWVAHSAGAAEELLESFLRRSRREMIFADVLIDNPWAPRLTNGKGFTVSRPLSRMYRGENSGPGRRDLTCSVLGPEFG
jgi:GNAT superfamily N-acetyltransferase